jgi:hypothetical protein
MEKRTIKKSFRFTQNEWALIEQKCKTINITPTQYFQQIAVYGKTAKSDCLKEKKVYIGQIAMIGNNINQIARKLNSNKIVDFWMLQILLKIEKNLTGKLLP